MNKQTELEAENERLHKAIAEVGILCMVGGNSPNAPEIAQQALDEISKILGRALDVDKEGGNSV